MNTTFKTSQRLIHVAAGSSVETGHPFRVIVRGNKADKRMREVRTVYAASLSNACDYMVHNGDKLLSDVRVKRSVDFVNVVLPTKDYLAGFSLDELRIIAK